MKKAIKMLNQDDELIENLKEALASGRITVNNLYVYLNSGQISLVEYVKSIKSVEEVEVNE